MTCKINLHNKSKKKKRKVFLQIDCKIIQINDIIHKCDLFKFHLAKIISNTKEPTGYK